MSERPEFEYYMGIANLHLPILGGEDSLKGELSDLVEESIYCIEDLETEIQTLKEKVRELEKDAGKFNLLMSSKRIRFLGSARIGKETGQVLCVEFHSSGEDHPKEHYDTEFTKERILKYIDALPEPPTKDPNITL